MTASPDWDGVTERRDRRKRAAVVRKLIEVLLAADDKGVEISEFGRQEQLPLGAIDRIVQRVVSSGLGIVIDGRLRIAPRPGSSRFGSKDHDDPHRS